MLLLKNRFQNSIQTIAILDNKIYAGTNTSIVVLETTGRIIQVLENTAFLEKEVNNFIHIKISPNGKYIAIYSLQPHTLFLAQINEDGTITNIKKISDSNIKNIIFHPHKNILAIFSMQKIKIYNYEKNIEVPYMSGVYKGRIATFNDSWTSLVTEVPDSVGISIFDTILEKKDYIDYFDTWSNTIPDVFDK